MVISEYLMNGRDSVVHKSAIEKPRHRLQRGTILCKRGTIYEENRARGCFLRADKLVS